jgi:hypothetical protein
MPKTPTFFDHFNVRDELRGVSGVEERRAIISKHVLANTRHFHKNHAEFPFDFDTPRVRELWAHVEETAEELARGECDVGHLGGAIQAWQVTVCEEYLERGSAGRETEEAHTAESSTAPEDDATNPPDIESKKESAASRKAKRGRESGDSSRRRPAQSPRKAPPAQPQSSGPQGSLFG